MGTTYLVYPTSDLASLLRAIEAFAETHDGVRFNDLPSAGCVAVAMNEDLAQHLSCLPEVAAVRPNQQYTAD